MVTEPTWIPSMIGQNSKEEPIVFGLSLLTETVRCDNPPKLGPDDDYLQWYEIQVTLVMGGRRIGDAVRFPAHKPLDPTVAFVTVMNQVLKV